MLPDYLSSRCADTTVLRILSIKRDYSGSTVGAIDFPFMLLQKASWWDNSALQLPLIICSLGILVLTILQWPVMAAVRRHYAKPLSLTPGQRRLRLLVRLACVVLVAFVAAFAGFFTFAIKHIEILSPRGNPWLRLIQLVGPHPVLPPSAAAAHAKSSDAVGATAAGRAIEPVSAGRHREA